MKRLVVLVSVLVLGVAVAFGPRFMGQQDAPSELAQRGFGPICAGTLFDEAAALLGLTVDELVDLRRDGMTFAQIAEQQEADIAELAGALSEFRDAAIARAVEEGTITEAQADRMRARGEPVVAAMLERDAPAWNGAERGGRHMVVRGGRAFASIEMIDECERCPDCPRQFGHRWNR